MYLMWQKTIRDHFFEIWFQKKLSCIYLGISSKRTKCICASDAFWPLSRPILVRFSKFFFLLKAYEKWFLKITPRPRSRRSRCFRRPCKMSETTNKKPYPADNLDGRYKQMPNTNITIWAFSWPLDTSPTELGFHEVADKTQVILQRQPLFPTGACN